MGEHDIYKGYPEHIQSISRAYPEHTQKIQRIYREHIQILSKLSASQQREGRLGDRSAPLILPSSRPAPQSRELVSVTTPTPGIHPGKWSALSSSCLRGLVSRAVSPQ
jgi:hypothetical protein